MPLFFNQLEGNSEKMQARCAERTKQRSSTELGCRRFAIAPLQLVKQCRPLLLRSRLPHDLAAVQRLGLARRLAGPPIRQQVIHRKGVRMRRVRVQRGHQRRARLDQPHPRVATPVDPTLVALREAKPTLQIERLKMDCRVVRARGRSATPTASFPGLGRCARTRRIPGTAAGSPAGSPDGDGAMSGAATRTLRGC
jgi:hypothetical protein